MMLKNHSKRSAGFACGITLLALVSLAPTTGFAQATEAEIAARRGLLEQAQQARVASDFPRALDLAQRAGRIQMTPSLRLFLAEVQAAMGNHAGAVGSADTCIRETERDTAARNREQILSNCRNIMTSSRARVGYVTVSLAAGAPTTTTITIGGAALNEALLGVPYVVNSGTVTVNAVAAGHVGFSQEVTVAAGATVPVEIQLDREAVVTTNVGAGAGTGTSTTTPSNTTGTTSNTTSTNVIQPPPPPPNRGSIPIGAVVLASAGALSLGTSLVFFLLRNSALTGCEIMNDMVLCNDAMSAAQVPSARTYALVSIATLGVGAAALVGGGIWLAVGLSSGGRPHAANRRPMVVPTFTAGGDSSFSLGIVGRF